MAEPQAVPKFLTFAHRGDSTRFPENTLPAFEHAEQLGVDVIETDVRLSRDGALMLFHDRALERTTNGHGALASHTLRELKELDAGYHFQPEQGHPFRGQGLTIPTLEELARACPKSLLNIDLKAEQRSAALVQRAINELGLESRVIITSSSKRRISTFRALAGSTVQTGASTCEVLWLYFRLLIGMRPKSLPYEHVQVPPRHGPLLRFDSRRFLDGCHLSDLKVEYWTINQQAEIQRLRQLGANGVMSDDSELLVSSLRP